MRRRPRRAPPRPVPGCRRMSPSSWTATAAGPRRAACPRRSATRPASRRCAAPSRPAIEQGVGWLTLFAFSSENWLRPAEEVRELTGLLRLYLRAEVATLAQGGHPAPRHRRPRPLRRRNHEARSSEAETQTAQRHAAEPERRLPMAAGPRSSPPPARSAEAVRDGTLDPADARRGELRPPAVHRRHAGPRPDHPHLRRAAAVELPALAGGLRRVRVPGRALARLRRRSPRRGHSRIRAGGSGATAPAQAEPSRRRGAPAVPLAGPAQAGRSRRRCWCRAAILCIWLGARPGRR